MIDDAFERRERIGPQTEGAVRVCRLALQIHGGVGVVDEYDVGRYMRDSLITPIYEGTSQIQSLMAVKDQLKWAMQRPRSLVGGGPSRLLATASFPGRVGSDFASARGEVVGMLRDVVGRLVRKRGVGLLRGSCAQIGKDCHISGGAGIGGVLEPLQAGPVIIEDNCFIGARSEVAEGVIVREGSVLSMGVFIGASTRIVDRETGATFQGEVPAYSVIVPGSLPGKLGKNGEPGPSLYCAVIVKRVDEKTRAKTSINELLRD